MSLSKISNYTQTEHRFNFAAWTATRAAQRGISGLDYSFVSGKLLNKLKDLSNGINQLPSCKEFDDQHKKWCFEVVLIGRSSKVRVTYGIAAKLINVYLKTLFLSDFGVKDQKLTTNCIHPPIDSFVLKNMSSLNCLSCEERRRVRKMKWTKLRSREYLWIIEKAKYLTDKELWRLEALWDQS